LDQIALILVDVCESYWPKYACPVFLGHSVNRQMDEWYTTVYCMTRSKVKVTEIQKLRKWPILKSVPPPACK